MTIRYKCSECGSVLKIRDELAGTDGKCPRCKTHFRIPDSEDDTPGIEVEESPEERESPAIAPRPSRAAKSLATVADEPESEDEPLALGGSDDEEEPLSLGDSEDDDEPLSLEDSEEPDIDDSEPPPVVTAASGRAPLSLHDSTTDDVSAADNAADEDFADEEDLVDLPIDLTPDVDTPDDLTPAAHGASFDPMDVLAGGGAPKVDRSSGGAATAERKPSVAELMRDFEKTKKKKAARQARALRHDTDSSAVAVATSGSAADTLNRNYERKRGKAPEPPPLSREQQRAAEEKAAMKRFAMQAAAGMAGVFVVGYFFMAWWMSEPLPDLVDVSGVVTLQGRPVSGAVVMFAPRRELSGPQVVAGSSNGRTDDEGRYVLMYDTVHEGAAVGTHDVELTTADGLGLRLPDHLQQVQVNADGDNIIDFNL